jgi:hypothetical protein
VLADKAYLSHENLKAVELAGGTPFVPAVSDGRREERAPYLPFGYYLDETDPDVVVLRRPNGSEVAAYGAAGADPKEIERMAWGDFRGREKPGQG